MLTLFAEIPADMYNAEGLAETIMMLHEGALVAQGMSIISDAVRAARDTALACSDPLADPRFTRSKINENA